MNYEKQLLNAKKRNKENYDIHLSIYYVKHKGLDSTRFIQSYMEFCIISCILVSIYFIIIFDMLIVYIVFIKFYIYLSTKFRKIF